MTAEPGVRAATFAPDAASPGKARRFAAGLVDGWGLRHLEADVTLCVSELAANAALHTRAPFTVTVRPAGPGVRVDVIDDRPEQLPVMVPVVGTAVDLTERSTTGRGLLIVAALADRWGVSTTHDAKAVWAELSGRPHEGPVAPTIVIGHPISPPQGQQLHYLGLPVRPAVASGIQTDEAAREVQLAELDRPGSDPARTRLLELLDETADLRLAGRYAALRAAAQELDRFDLDVVITAGLMASMAELAEQLDAVSGAPAGPAAPDEAVLAFRAWLSDEGLRQWGGEDPVPCPLPS